MHIKCSAEDLTQVSTLDCLRARGLSLRHGEKFKEIQSEMGCPFCPLMEMQINGSSQGKKMIYGNRIGTKRWWSEWQRWPDWSEMHRAGREGGTR